MQSAAPSRATPASQISDAASSLSQRIQQLRLPALQPADVVALFNPQADAGKTSLRLAAMLADAAQFAQLKRVLLTQDVRDKFERNVLHLAVSRR
jgi:hypothetical protein